MKINNCVGINIGGCEFQDFIYNGNSNNGYALGANIINSSLNMSKSGDACGVGADGDPCSDNIYSNPLLSVGCKFTTMDLGVKYLDNQDDNHFTIRSSDFIDNKQDLQIDRVNKIKLAYNTHSFDAANYSTYYGSSFKYLAIKIDEYSNIYINENDFDYFDKGALVSNFTFLSIGTLYRHGRSTIRKNKFMHDRAVTTCGLLSEGIFFDGNNMATDLECNTFIHIAYDIRLSATASVAIWPLDLDYGTGNSWSTLGNAPSCPYANYAVPNGSAQSSVIGIAPGLPDKPNQNPSSTSIYKGLPTSDNRTKANDCLETKCEDNIILSVKRPDHEQNLKVYPNPTVGNFTIEVNNNEVETVELYSILGKKLASISNFESINFSDGIEISNAYWGDYKGMMLCKVILKNGNSANAKIIVQ